ncbi:MAG: ABC transporter permease [Caldilineaceae bacterium]
MSTTVSDHPRRLLPTPDRAAPRSQWSIVWRALRRNKLALLGMVIILVLFVACFGAPYLTNVDPNKMSPRERLDPPSAVHILGTDSFGRDMLTRILYGGRVSLAVGFASVAILTTIGVVVGAAAGYYGGLVDTLLMRFVDVMLSVPNFFLLLAVVALFGPSLRNTMLVIGLTSWMATARLVRGQFLAERQKDYILSAQYRRHRQPHHLAPSHASSMAVIIVYATLWIAFAVILEASLSYLGLGAQPPTASWGNMLREGRRYMREAWWVTTFPGVFIFSPP